jgi:hypothetical protein
MFCIWQQLYTPHRKEAYAHSYEQKFLLQVYGRQRGYVSINRGLQHQRSAATVKLTNFSRWTYQGPGIAMFPNIQLPSQNVSCKTQSGGMGKRFLCKPC